MTKPDIAEQMLQDSVFALFPDDSNAGKVTYQRSARDVGPEVKTAGELDFQNPRVPMSEDAIIGIGSITKQFVAATLLKLWDEEI
jgi:CubicO group peptidase (beta-lactamase class C family)